VCAMFFPDRPEELAPEMWAEAVPVSNGMAAAAE
jgi:hypothetical protein